MKVRWQFYFEYEDFSFEKQCIYSVPISKTDAEKFGLPPSAFEAKITIEAEEEKLGEVKQRGKINIFLSGNNNQTKDLAYALATGLEQKKYRTLRLRMKNANFGLKQIRPNILIGKRLKFFWQATA